MTTDEKVVLARELAHELKSRWVEIQKKKAEHQRKHSREKKFPRNEWQRWVNYFSRVRDFNKALKLVEYQGRSYSLRDDPRKASQVIYSVLHLHRNDLQRISVEDLLEIFGYVHRWLAWMNEGGYPLMHRART